MDYKNKYKLSTGVCAKIMNSVNVYHVLKHKKIKKI